MRDFKNLKVWEKAHALTLKSYEISKHFPDAEKFGLVSQLRRAAASISTNIAEGCGRDTDRDFARFMIIAAGSTSEVEYQILLSKDLGYINVEQYKILDDEINEIKRMLNSFIRKLTANR